ncbi:MAG TPA: sulfatase, partial [Planctomycetota bacterium]|nr:sulfatase [Planctomycetota bacterium]
MVSNGNRKRWGLVVLGGAIVATLLAGLLLVPRALPNRASAVRRPSVILVLVDAMRADRLGSSGHPGNLTPHLDRLAQRGWRFTRAYSAAPSTVRSVASLFTSTAPSVHRISAPPGEGRDLSVLPAGFLLLPEAFQEQGYRTAMVTTTGWVTPEAGYDQGVDEYILVSREDEEVLRAGVDFVARHAEQEFFVYLHLLDLHDYYHSERMFAPHRSLPPDLSPRFLALRGKQPSEIYSAFYDQPETFTAADVRFLEQAYDEAVRETDRQIGALASRLAELGLGDDVLLVVTSDHGEQFGEHGLLVHGANGFYDEVLRVPLVLSGGPTASSPRVVLEPVSSLDVFPTLLDLADIEVPDVVQGRSLADIEEQTAADAVD